MMRTAAHRRCYCAWWATASKLPLSRALQPQATLLRALGLALVLVLVLVLVQPVLVLRLMLVPVPSPPP
jgi:hypothetical protein